MTNPVNNIFCRSLIHTNNINIKGSLTQNVISITSSIPSNPQAYDRYYSLTNTPPWQLNKFMTYYYNEWIASNPSPGQIFEVISEGDTKIVQHDLSIISFEGIVTTEFPVTGSISSPITLASASNMNLLQYNNQWRFVNATTTGFTFVDINGNNATAQINNPFRPFQTIMAARDANSSIATIVVRPGTYTVTTTLLKEGISYYFQNGCTVNANTQIFRWPGTTQLNNSGVYGYGVFTTTSGSVININNTNDIIFEAVSMVANADTITLAGTLQHVTIRVNTLTSNNNDCVMCNATTGIIDITCVEMNGNGGVRIANGSVQMTVRGSIFSATGTCVRQVNGTATLLMLSNTLSSAGNRAVQTSAGVTSVTASLIQSATTESIRVDGPAFLSVYADELQSGATSRTLTIMEGSTYAEVRKMKGFQVSSTASAFLYASEMTNVSATIPAINTQGSSTSTIYVNTETLITQSTCTINGMNTFQFYLSASTITSPTNPAFTMSGGSSYFNSITSAGYSITGGVSHNITGIINTANTNCISVSGNTSTIDYNILNNFGSLPVSLARNSVYTITLRGYFKNTANLATSHAISILSGAQLPIIKIIDSVLVTTNAAARSINAAGAAYNILRSYGSLFANVTTNNVAFLTGAITVDVDVL